LQSQTPVTQVGQLESLASIIDSCFDAILTVDRDRTIVFCNPAFTQLFGYELHEIFGKSMERLHLSEAKFHEFGQTVLRTAQDQGRFRGEWRYRHKEGREILAETAAAPQVARDGSLIGFIVIMRDITTKRQTERAVVESESRFRELFENMRSGVAVYAAVDAGRDFVIKDFNHAAEAIESIARGSVLGRRVSEVFPGIQEFGLLEVMRRVWQTGRAQHFPLARYADDRIQGWRDHYVYRLASGEIVAIYDDLTAAKQAEEALVESEERLQKVLNAIQVGIVIIDPQTRTIVDVNPMAAEMIGLPREEITGKTCHRFICPAEEGNCPVIDHGQLIDSKHRELIRADGKRIPILKTVTRVVFNGREHLVESFQDITEIKRLEDQLRTLATIDALTGIFNRRHFFERAEEEWARAERYRHPLSLLLFDIDHFKSINDRCGHPAGDEVLRQTAETVKAALRRSDLFGRIGGEEFAVLLPESGLEQSLATAERVRQAVAGRRFEVSAAVLSCTVSIGLAERGAAGDSLDALMQRADEALYTAKREGRNEIRIARGPR
jgi:diguanylate cyclase (GGDEF)-like protein/PAS domain S-box-containing protein